MRTPAWKLLTIRQSLVKNIDRTTPHMEVMELALFPPCLREQVDVGSSYKTVEGQTFLYSHPSQDDSVTTGREKLSFGSLSLFSLLSTNLVDNSSIRLRPS
jgi:hypothetical protein